MTTRLDIIQSILNEWVAETQINNFKKYANNPDTFNRRVKSEGDFRVFLLSLSLDELQELCENFGFDFEWPNEQIEAVKNSDNFAVGLELEQIQIYLLFHTSPYMAYKAFRNGELLFEGNDYKPAPSHNCDSLEAIVDLLGFLTVKEGDTDPDYFKNYTPAQIEWTKTSDCEDVLLLVADFEDDDDKARQLIARTTLEGHQWPRIESKEIYAVEWNGDFWQSVFPSHESEKSETHTSKEEAIEYMRAGCGVTKPIQIIGLEKSHPEFPNGFTSWQETHYEIVQAMTEQLLKENDESIVTERQDEQGHGGLYELAEQLTNEFELKYKGYSWGFTKDENGNPIEYFDTIEKFCHDKFNSK